MSHVAVPASRRAERRIPIVVNLIEEPDHIEVVSEFVLAGEGGLKAF
jgi:hypothetical protein